MCSSMLPKYPENHDSTYPKHGIRIPLEVELLQTCKCQPIDHLYKTNKKFHRRNPSKQKQPNSHDETLIN